ncbi:MAG: phage minor capsid protein [Leptospira sp.]|nr:phage minor capsid protein [Leptospira sp.]
MATAIQVSELLRKVPAAQRMELARLLRRTVDLYDFSDKNLLRIRALLEDIKNIQETILFSIVINAYVESFDKVTKPGKAITLLKTPSIDLAAAKQLAFDTLRDLNHGFKQGETYIRSIFKTAKQDILSETKISEIVLNDIMSEGTFKKASKSLGYEMQLLGSTNNTTIRQLSEKELRSRFNSYKKKLAQSKELPAGLRKYALGKAEEKLRDGKFVTIIDKNGKPRTYSLDYYTDMVAQSRFADAQVEGTIAAGEKLGAHLFLVTFHNTETPKCQQYEDKYLSSDEKLIGKYFEGREILRLTEDSKPIYHVNCKHRLLVVPITSDEYNSIVGERNAA